MQSGHWGAWPAVAQEVRGRQHLGPALFTASWVLFNISKEKIEVVKSSEASSSFFFFFHFLCPDFLKDSRKAEALPVGAPSITSAGPTCCHALYPPSSSSREGLQVP